MSKNLKELTNEQKSKLKIEQEKAEHKKKVVRISIILILLMLIMAALIVNFTDDYFKNKSNQLDPDAMVGQLKGKTPAEVQKELNRVVSNSNLIISINSNIEMSSGTSKAPVKIENVPNNHYNMKVAINLKGEDTVIYESGLIEPNYHIDEVTFDTVLKKGTYNAIATFSAYNIKTEKYVGKQQAEIKITVKK